MNQKLITVIAVTLAVIAAAVAAIVVSNRRADEAWAYAEAEKAVAKTQEDETKAKKAEAAAEASKKEAAAETAKAKADELKAQKLAQETAQIEAKTAADQKAAAEETAKAEKAKAEAARDARDEAKHKAETARIEQQKAKELAAAEAAKSEAEAAKLAAEKLRSEKVIAEAELRKRDYDHLVQWSQDLADKERELVEREKALTPEKTIADLAWAGGTDDTVIDDKGNVRKFVKVAYDPEKDPMLPEATRRLARAERQVRQAQSNQVVAVRSAVTAKLEKLYVQALKDGRVIDAEHYRKNILQMYPDWKFAGETPAAK